jgi:monothiol glutaredoxin
MTDSVNDRISSLVSENKVVLFMKGTPFFPQCGFSSTAIAILERLNVEFETVDVLADAEIRQGIKAYSDWPTIPQLYIGGEFVGGSDIMMEMFQDGELATLLEQAGAAPSAA